MTHTTRRLTTRPVLLRGAAALALVAAPTVVSAQGTWPGRVVVSVNAGVQSASQTFSDRITFPVYQEEARFDVAYAVEPGPFFDGGAMIRLFGNVGAGVSVSSFSDDRAASIDGSLPHPFHFSQPRSIEGEAANLRHQETGVHLQFAYMAAATERVRVIVSGGPSWISVERGLVTDVNYSEEYPFDTATFMSVDREIEKESAVGFNVGADVIWAFTKNFGVGGLIRFTRATTSVSPGQGRSIELELGGLHAGGGIRVLF